MVKMVNKGAPAQNQESSEKRDHILRAAQKVFGQYGFEKSSMNDIALELDASKASLYYYFQDKESLFKAVIRKEQQQFLKMLKEIIRKPIKASEQLSEYVKLRHNLFSTFLNISKLRIKESAVQKSFMYPIINDLRSQEIKLTCEIFKKGIKEKEFRDLDPLEITILFMDIIKGLRIITMRNAEENSTNSNPDEILLKRTATLMNLFLNGIKNR